LQEQAVMDRHHASHPVFAGESDRVSHLLMMEHWYPAGRRRRTRTLGGRLLMTVLTVTAVACGGSPNEPSGTPGSLGIGETMTAVVDGVSFTSASTAATLASGFFAVSGSNVPNTLVVGVSAPAAVGTYAIPRDLANATVINPAGLLWSADASGGSGSITIAAITTNSARGTFSFTTVPRSSGVNGNRVVTNGAFNVSF
jgi:hypothetical protein